MIGVPALVIAVVAYVRPPDPAHPMRFDLFSHQVLLPIWLLLLLFIAVCVGLISIPAVIRRRVAASQPRAVDLAFPDPTAGMVPIPFDYLKLEQERDDAKKLHFHAQQALDRTAQELDEARKQLETPKIVLSIFHFDVYEEVAKGPPSPNERLIYGTNNRILLRVHLKLSNAHRVETNIQSIGLAIRGTPNGKLINGGPPTEFPEILRQPIKFGLLIDVSLDFWIDHADAQTVVKNDFVIAAQDGAGEQLESDSKHISRVLPDPPQKASKGAPTHEFWEWVGQIKHEAFEGEMLLRDLGRLEYSWDTNGTKLIYPLADHAMPSPGEPLSYLQRELLGFRFRYKAYLVRITGIVADDFKSVMVDRGFPSNINTHDLKEVMQLHIDGLRSHAEKWIKEQTAT